MTGCGFFSGEALARNVIERLIFVAQHGGDLRTLTFLLNMEAALDAGNIARVQFWMKALEKDIARRKAAR